VKPVEVEGNFADEREWLVEKILLSSSKDKFFAVPNSMILSSNPFIPIANTSDTPRYIRKGEVVGEITDPAKFFDSPQTAEQLDKYVQSANRTPALIASLLHSDQPEEVQPLHALEESSEVNFAPSTPSPAKEAIQPPTPVPPE
jgi:hypothetical protein